MESRSFHIVWTCCLLLWMPGDNAAVAGDEPPVYVTAGERPPMLSQSLPYGGLLMLIVSEAFKESNRRVDSAFFPWPRAYDFARQRKWDASIGWIRTAQREKDFFYSDPVIEISSLFFYRSDIPFSWNTFDDLEDYRIGVIVRQSYGEDFDAARKEGRFKVQTYPNEQRALSALYRRDVDLVPVNAQTAPFILESLLPDMSIIVADEKPLIEQPVYLIAAKSKPNSEALLQSFNRGLDAIKRSGQYDKILRSYSMVLLISQLKFFSEEYAPLNYTQNGVLTGLIADVFAAVLQELGSDKTIEDVVVVPWVRAYEAALQRDDVVLFAMTRTEQREDLFKWAGPIHRSRIVLTARKSLGAKISRTEDARQYTTCVVNNDVGEELMLSLGLTADRLLVASSAENCAKMLSSGRVDLWAYGDDVAKWYLTRNAPENSSYDYETVYLLNESSQYIAFSKGVSDVIVDRFQAALDKLQLLGVTREISQGYGLQ